MKPGMFLTITRPYVNINEITCISQEVIRIDGNIQEAIDNKISKVIIHENPIREVIIDGMPHHRRDHSVNSFEYDIYPLLAAGHIQFLVICGHLKPNDKKYHVDFVSDRNLYDNLTQIYTENTGKPALYNVTSYYSCRNGTEKTVVLGTPIAPITNDLISLGDKCPEFKDYEGIIASKFIGNHPSNRRQNRLNQYFF